MCWTARNTMSTVGDGDVNIDDLLRDLEDAEAKDAQASTAVYGIGRVT